MNSFQDPKNPDSGNKSADETGSDGASARAAEIRHDRWVTMPPEGWVDGTGHALSHKPRSLSETLSPDSGEVLSSKSRNEPVQPQQPPYAQPQPEPQPYAQPQKPHSQQPPITAPVTAAAIPLSGGQYQAAPGYGESYYDGTYSEEDEYDERRRFYWSLKILRDVILPLIIAFVVAMFAQATVAKPYQIPSGSMLPTIQLQDRILANRLVYRLHGVEHGDVIVFQPPAGVEQGTPYVKRVIGLPGDTVEIRNGKTKVNGEDFEVASASTPTYTRSRETVPDGMLFVLGDNRNESSDSHIWGYVPVDNIIGRADVVYWPPKDMRLLGM